MTDYGKKAEVAASAIEERPQLAATGLEAEFALVLDDKPVRPERVFGDPRGFIRGPLVHRIGNSYHIPTGGAVYFDTGVIEVVTPIIEVDRGCGARAGRSLWEAIRYVRDELDAWQQAGPIDARLVGFSTHYNVSFEHPPGAPRHGCSIDELAVLLTYILAAPVMLFAANRRSTGVGVRPRTDRIEVTVDFTPNAALMIATATLVAGITRAVMRWPTFRLDQLERTRIPVVQAFRPLPHTTRRGWVARHDSFGHARNPFQEGPDTAWTLRDGTSATLRDIAGRVIKEFWGSIRELADPFTARLIRSVLSGRTPSLLDLPDRPPEYEDVGRVCRWDDLYPTSLLSRSRYERVLMRAISGERLNMRRRWYTPTGMRGWSHVVFRRDDDGSQHAFPVDYLLRHLDAWERPHRRTSAPRSVPPAISAQA